MYLDGSHPTYIFADLVRGKGFSMVFKDHKVAENDPIYVLLLRHHERIYSYLV
jgi:hypothetical protein